MRRKLKRLRGWWHWLAGVTLGGKFEMKTVLTKSLVGVVGAALGVPFAVAAELVGARAVAGAGGAKQLLLMAALALVWTLFGGVKGFARDGEDEREGHELLVGPRRRGARRQTFLHTRGF